jgi:trigger factor
VKIDLIRPVHGKNKSWEDTDVMVEIGAGNLLDNFEQHLVGKSIGETVEFFINYPKNYKDRSVAGKKICHLALVKQIFKCVERKLDDEFAAVAGFENLNKMKEWAASMVHQRHEKITRDIMKRNMLENLSSMYNFDVPQNMVTAENKEVIRQITEEGTRLGKKITPLILQECLKIAKERVRLGFIIAEVARKEKIAVSKGEITRAIQQLSVATGGQERDIWKLARNASAMQAIVGPLLEEKVVTFLLEKVKIVEETCSWKRLVEIDEEPFEFFADTLEEEKKAAVESPESIGKSENKEKSTVKKRSSSTKKKEEK